MSRLLFAAARGARIEDNVLGSWSKSEMIWVDGCNYDYRIHPDDEHLQYGPISTALRDMATTGEDPALSHTDDFGTWSTLYSDWCAYQYSTESKLHRSLFLLILAEALAEEGL